MRALVVLVTVGILSISIAVAADSLNAIDAVVQKHRATVERATAARTSAIKKSQDDSVGMLLKLANSAYSKRDRLSETNAWKAILQLDRDHPRARQYFADLGNLEATLAALPKNEDLPSAIAPFVGKWRIYRDGQGINPSFHFVIFPEGTIAFDGAANAARIKFERFPDRNEYYYNTGNCFHRCMIAGDRLIVEQWCGLPGPVKTIPDAPISWIIFGIRETN